MRPIKLTFAGLRSYRAETTIDFANLDLFAVIGDTGAGKSTIIEALCLALYARKSWAGGAKLEQLISDGEKAMRIELTFSAAGDEWVVTRVRRRSGATSIDKLVSPTGGLGADGAAQVTDRVADIIGLNYDQFTRAVVLPQGRFDSMLQAGEKERNAILTSILDLDDIVATRMEVERLRAEWSPKLSAWNADRSHFPPDPAEALTAARALAASAERRAKLLGDAVTAVDEHRASAGTVEAIRQSLRAALAVEPAVDDGAIRDLERRHTRWVELAIAAATAERGVRESTERLQALELRATESLAGFERRDDLVTIRHGIEQAEQDLPARLERIESRRAAVHDLEAAPPSADVPAELLADAAEQQAVHAAARKVLEASTQAVEQGRRLWDARAIAEHRVGALTTAIATQQEHVEQAEQVAKASLDVATAAEGTVIEARVEVRRALVADAAATAAAACVPGDGCPVCARPLPDDFVPPVPATDTAAAETALARAEAELKTATAAAQTAATDVASRRSELERLGRDAIEASAARDEARAAAVAGGVQVDASDVEAGIVALVAEREQVASAAAAAEQAAGESAAAVARGEAAAEAAVKAHRKDLKSAQGELAKEEQVVEQTAALIDALPAALAVVGADDLLERVGNARQAMTDAVAALDAIDVERAQRAKELQGAQRQVADLSTQIRDEGRDPAAATLRMVNPLLVAARAIRRATEEAAPVIEEATPALHAGALDEIATATTPEELADRIAAVAAAMQIATQVRTYGSRVLAAADARGEAVTKAVAAVLAEVGATTVDSLRTEWGTAQEQRRTSGAAVEAAELMAAKAAVLDEILAIARPFTANLEVLAVALRDQNFIAHLVDAREAELLAEASRRLKAITKGRFGFVADFGVVSIASGEVRSADTLSGGERFQAALALALALVEIASRGGGRLDAVFIDEGFGSLDSNALDVALETLGLVSGDGKMVALISHLRPVAEYVDTVLHVTKDDTLGSRIALLDAEAHDQMLADDTRSGLTT